MASPAGRAATSSSIAARARARARSSRWHGSETDVVAHGVGDQLRHLREERRVRRHEEGGAVGEALSVPAHFAGYLGLPGQTEQGAQHRALAGADRAR